MEAWGIGMSNDRPRQAARAIPRAKRDGQAVPRSYYWWPITDAKIRRATRKIVDAVHPEKVILFGSFAYGKPTPDSDVDLLVIMESDLRPHARVVQISEILSPRPFPVDIIVRTPSEVKERIAKRDSFFLEIMAKGKLLYERPSR